MAQNNKFSKGLGDVFSTLGAVAGPLGQVLLGPDARGIDFGAPFATVGALISKRNQEQGLMDALSQDPTTAPLIQGLAPLADQPGGLLGQLQGQEQPQQQIDFGSPEFLQQLIGSGNQDLAKNIIASKATQKGMTPADMLMMQYTLLGKQAGLEKTMVETDRLRNMPLPETPEQKLSRQKELASFTAKVPTKPGTVPAGIDKKLTETGDFVSQVDSVVNRYQTISSQLPAIKSPEVSAALGKYFASNALESDSGRLALQQLSQQGLFPPEFMGIFSDMKGLAFDVVKEKSGLSYTDKQLEKLQAIMPNVLDDPQALQMRLQDLQAAYRAKFLRTASSAKDYQNIDDYLGANGFEPTALEDFDNLKKFDKLINSGKATPRQRAVYDRLINELGLRFSFQ